MAVAAGSLHSLGLKLDGSIVAFGWNDYGQCSVPDPNTGFVAVAAGGAHSLGLKSDGSIVAWGYNIFGECDVPDPNTGFVAVAAGEYHSLGLKSDGSIVAWGRNDYGECNVPDPNTGFLAVAAGFSHSLGLKSDGSIVAWGDNSSGQCDVPDPNIGFTAVAAGVVHSLGLKSDGSIVAWGNNEYDKCNVPLPNTGFVAVAAGSLHNLGLKSDGSLVAWGYNGSGQCNVPEPNTGFVAVVAGEYHSLGLKGDLDPLMFGNINGKNVKLKTADANGVIVKFSLTGGGYGQVRGRTHFGQVELYDTTKNSLLTILTKGKTETSVGNIISDGPLLGILAKTTDLRGDITVNGSLGMLTLDDVADGHAITIGSSANPKAGVLMKFDEVNDLTIDSDMPIKTLSATDWAGGSIDAPSVGSIMVKGDKKRGIPGDFGVDVTLKDGTVNSVRVAGILSGVWTCDAVKSISAANIEDASLTLTQEPNDRILALGSLTARGWITDSQISSSGNIGTVTAGAVQDSSCFAGVTATRDLDADGVLDLPDPNADIDYVHPAAIKSIKINGIKGQSPPYVINSNIAAARILSAYLADPNTSNSGVIFGIAADYIKALKVKDDTGIHSYKDLHDPNDNYKDNDFKILLH